MDVTLGMLIPVPDLSHKDDFADIIDAVTSNPVATDPDDVFDAFDFEPMDLCAGSEDDGFIMSCIDDLPLAQTDDETNTAQQQQQADDVRARDSSQLSKTVALMADTTTNITTTATSTYTTNDTSLMCSICKANIPASSSSSHTTTTEAFHHCARCSPIATKSPSCDSGIGSGDDVTDSSSDAGGGGRSESSPAGVDNKQLCDNSNDVTPRRSSRRKTSSSSRSSSGSGADKEYNLRTTSLINRVEVERRKATPKERKPKSKPPPLSKYRRKTANARERTRMTEINEGFEELKSVIPDLPKGKLTKITTLRLALSYISALRSMLGYKDDYECEPSERPSSVSSSSSSSSAESSSSSAVSSSSTVSSIPADDAMNAIDERTGGGDAFSPPAPSSTTN